MSNDLLIRALALAEQSRASMLGNADWLKELEALHDAHGRQAFDPKIKTSAKAPEGRNFPFARPRRWRNKTLGEGKGVPGEFKVLPWFQPIDNESRIDFKCLLKDLMPELSDDMMAEFEIYSGLMVHAGWQLHNDAGMWFCIQRELKDQFDDLGDWDDKDGKQIPAFPLTEKSMKEKAERENAK